MEQVVYSIVLAIALFALLGSGLWVAISLLCVAWLGMVLFTVVKLTIGLRVSEEEELRGLDIAEHGNEGYHGFQIFANQ